MAIEADALRDWHRLFGLLLDDFFTGSPFTVEIERDLSQQQLLDVVILRRGRGRLLVRLPDGLEDLAAHNLITFKSHREALDSWTMKELIGHYVAYRKLVSPSTSDLLPESQFRLHAVCARLPEKLLGQVPWQQRQAGVYHCQWGTDEIRIIVAGQLPRVEHNAPLHLFSASPELFGFGQRAYQRRSENTSLLLGQLFVRIRGEGIAMSYTIEDFKRDVFRKRFLQMSPEERRELLEELPPEEQQALALTLPAETRLAGLSEEQIRAYLDQLTASERREPRKPRRKK